MGRTWRFLAWTLLALLLLVIGCSPGYSSPKAQEKTAPTTQEATIPAKQEATTPAAQEATAPDFRLNSLEGQSVALSDFRGNPVLVNFWATWCGPCRAEMPYLQQVYDRWTDKGLVLLTVDIGEEPRVIKKYFEENGLSMPVLLDIDQGVARRYNITGIPTTLLIDGNGIIRKRQVGAYPNVAAIEKDLALVMH